MKPTTWIGAGGRVARPEGEAYSHYANPACRPIELPRVRCLTPHGQALKNPQAETLRFAGRGATLQIAVGFSTLPGVAVARKNGPAVVQISVNQGYSS